MKKSLLSKDIEEWQFAGVKDECDYLFGLVKSGVKTATSWLYGRDDKFEEFSVLTNWDKTEKLLLKTKKYEIKKFCEVTTEHAYKEGEGERTLSFWRKMHYEFFCNRCKEKKINFDENTLIVCEEFEVLEFDYGR